MRVMQCYMCKRSGAASDNNKLYVCPDCAPLHIANEIYSLTISIKRSNAIAINILKERTDTHAEEANKKNDT